MNNQKPRPYIGVTGVMTKDEASKIQMLYRRTCNEQLRGKRQWPDLMIGVLVSSKTLAGGTNNHPNRYPRMNDISSILMPSSSGNYRAINLVHYSTDDEESVRDQLDKVAELAGDGFNGFQLNMPWPNPFGLYWGKSRGRPKGEYMVLRIGPRTLGEPDQNPNHLIDHIADYRQYGWTETDLIDAVLFDISGGHGQPFALDDLLPYVEALVRNFPSIGIGVADGLCDGTIESVKPLIKICPYLSINAMELLLDEDGNLDLEKVKDYFDTAIRELYAPQYS